MIQCFNDRILSNETNFLVLMSLQGLTDDHSSSISIQTVAGIRLFIVNTVVRFDVKLSEPTDC